MNSAAVIGRQLRQQQASNRISGPVVPPTQYKGVDADKKFAQFSQLYSHEFYPHPAHREKGEKSARGKEKKKKEPRVQLSWHCFCVALKALSSGIVLFVAGTVMSIVGFFADSLSQENIRLQNGTEVTNVNNDVKTHLHNLTYVGPVIMGLGGIVIVAACVLTFEVRDTLGVKANPKRDQSSPEKSNLQMTSNCLSSVEQDKIRKLSNNTINQNHSGRHSASKSNSNHRQVSSKPRPDVKQPDTGQTQDRSNSGGNNHENAKTNDRTTNKTSPDSGKPVTEPDTPLSNQLQSESSNDLFSIDMSFARIPSPQETEISDPEGCSLSAMSRWKSRCSCSGSPSNSMLLALHGLEDRQRSPLCGHNGNYGSITPKNGLPLLCQLPQRYSKILASVESDGLSSSSSEWDIDYQMVETQQTLHNDRHLANKLDTRELPPNAFYLRTLGQYNSTRPSGMVTLTVPHHPQQSPVSVDLKHKSVQYSSESSQVCYPLLRMSSLEWAQAKSDCNSHH